MRYIYFVRHSIRDFTIREDREVPLTAEGIQLAEALKPFFINKKITTIYTSPYLRAVQTVEPTAKLLGIEMRVKEELKERKVGTWVDDFSEFAISQWADFDYKLENGESLNEVQERIKTVYSDIINQGESNIIISGHGTALAVLFNDILQGKFGYQEFQEMTMPDVYCAEYDGDELLKFFKPSSMNVRPFR